MRAALLRLRRHSTHAKTGGDEYAQGPSHVLWLRFLDLGLFPHDLSAAHPHGDVEHRHTPSLSASSPHTGNIRNLWFSFPALLKNENGTRDVALEIDVKRQHLSIAIVGRRCPSHDPSPRPHFLRPLRRVQEHVPRLLCLRHRSRCRSNLRLHPLQGVLLLFTRKRCFSKRKVHKHPHNRGLMRSEAYA